MIFFDLITLAAIGWMIFRGKGEGFVSQLISLIGIAIGVALSISYGESIGQALGINQQFAAIVGFLIIFIITIVVATILTKALSKIVSVIGLNWLNTILGVLFSIVKGLVILSMFYAAIYAINERIRLIEPKKFDESVSFNVVRKVADPLFKYWDQTKPIEKLSATKE